MKKIKVISNEKIPEYTGLKNENVITIPDGTEWDGHAFAEGVGIIYSDGKVESFFKKDRDNGTHDIFDKLKNDIRLVEKQYYFRNHETLESSSGTKYYIPYKVVNHCSDIPTVTDCYVDGSSNVKYEVKYEIHLVTDEGYEKFIVESYKTEGSNSQSFYVQIHDLENTFEEWFEDVVHGFKTDEDGNKTVDFYDETGDKVDIEVERIYELLSMITSMRVIKLDYEVTN